MVLLILGLVELKGRPRGAGWGNWAVARRLWQIIIQPQAVLGKDLISKMPSCRMEGSSEITVPGVSDFPNEGITGEAV